MKNILECNKQLVESAKNIMDGDKPTYVSTDVNINNHGGVVGAPKYRIYISAIGFTNFHDTPEGALKEAAASIEGYRRGFAAAEKA